MEQTIEKRKVGVFAAAVEKALEKEIDVLKSTARMNGGTYRVYDPVTIGGKLIVTAEKFTNAVDRRIEVRIDELEKHLVTLRTAERAYEQGEISAKMLVKVAVGIVILSAVIPAIWPLIAGSDDDIQAMNGTDAGTGFIQTFWPILVTVGGIGIGVGALYYAIKKMGIGN